LKSLLIRKIGKLLIDNNALFHFFKRTNSCDVEPTVQFLEKKKKKNIYVI